MLINVLNMFRINLLTIRQSVILQSMHYELSSAPFCLLTHSPWMIVFALSLVFVSLSICNIYMWKGIYYSFSNIFILGFVFVGLVVSIHYWFRDVARWSLWTILCYPDEIPLISLFLVFLTFVVSEALSILLVTSLYFLIVLLA